MSERYLSNEYIVDNRNYYKNIEPDSDVVNICTLALELRAYADSITAENQKLKNELNKAWDAVDADGRVRSMGVELWQVTKRRVEDIVTLTAERDDLKSKLVAEKSAREKAEACVKQLEDGIREHQKISTGQNAYRGVTVHEYKLWSLMPMTSCGECEYFVSGTSVTKASCNLFNFVVADQARLHTCTSYEKSSSPEPISEHSECRSEQMAGDIHRKSALYERGYADGYWNRDIADNDDEYLRGYRSGNDYASMAVGEPKIEKPDKDPFNINPRPGVTADDIFGPLPSSEKPASDSPCDACYDRDCGLCEHFVLKEPTPPPQPAPEQAEKKPIESPSGSAYWKHREFVMQILNESVLEATKIAQKHDAQLKREARLALYDELIMHFDEKDFDNTVDDLRNLKAKEE